MRFICNNDYCEMGLQSLRGNSRILSGPWVHFSAPFATGRVQRRAAFVQISAWQEIRAPTLRPEAVNLQFPLWSVAGKLRRASANKHRRGSFDSAQDGSSTPRHKALRYAIGLRGASLRGCDFFDLACSLWLESSEEHLPTGIAGVLRLRAMSRPLCDRSARRFAQSL